MHRYFITGIHTGIGKTLVSTILTEKLRANYWKPIQSGTDEGTDSNWVRQHLSNTKSVVYPEAYLLQEPMSPHAAANIEEIDIELSKIKIPNKEKDLIVEGAGGILVPINAQETILDLIKHLKLEVILVSAYYLGSINHTLMSIEVLQNHKVPVKGIIFNGDRVQSSFDIIKANAPWPILAEIPVLPQVDKQIIREVAGLIEDF
jgi:dethiobiotin synthetase